MKAYTIIVSLLQGTIKSQGTPPSNGYWCVDSLTCQQYTDSWQTSQTKSCLNYCQNYSSGSWTQCTYSSCQTPTTVNTYYCSAKGTCSQWTGSGWGASPSTTCLSECPSYTQSNPYVQCTHSQCGPSTSGNYCTSATECKTYDSTTNDYTSTSACANQCYNFVQGQPLLTCNPSTCGNPPAIGAHCYDKSTCKEWNGSGFTASSATCFNQCRLTTWSNYPFYPMSGAPTCTVSNCLNPTLGQSYCTSSNMCNTIDSSSLTYSAQTPCFSGCYEYPNKPNDWTYTCTPSQCVLTSAGDYCSSATECKTFDAATGDWSTSISPIACANQCHGFVAGQPLQTCSRSTCSSPPSIVAYYCVSATECKAWDRSYWTTLKSSTCFNYCRMGSYPTTSWTTTCSMPNCLNPPNSVAYCANNKECRTWDNSLKSWAAPSSSTESLTCLSQCQGYATNNWSLTCTPSLCGPSAAGDYCASATECKTYDSVTGDWSTTQSAVACANQCYGYVSGQPFTTCNRLTCASPPNVMQDYCVSNTECIRWSYTAWSTSKSTTCFNYCRLGSYPSTTLQTCTRTYCLNPPSQIAYCASQNQCRTWDNINKNWAVPSSSTESLTCLSGCQNYVSNNWSLTCTPSTCGPSTAGDYCTSSTECKTIDPITGLWSTTSQCWNQCYDFDSTLPYKTCDKSKCASPPNVVESYCLSETLCRYWYGTYQSTSQSTTCFNYCRFQSYPSTTFTTCSRSNCQNPPNEVAYCANTKWCRTWDNSSKNWAVPSSSTQSLTCLSGCQVYTYANQINWSQTCSPSICGPSTAGDYCASATDCKTYNVATGDWGSSMSCANQCHDFVQGQPFKTCTKSQCYSPPINNSGYYCLSKTKCMYWNGSQLTSTRSTTCFSYCMNFQPLSSTYTTWLTCSGTCQNPPQDQQTYCIGASCRKWDLATLDWSEQQPQCLIKCQGSNILNWKVCQMDKCGPTSPGSYCSARERCATYDGVGWTQINYYCSNYCYYFNENELPTSCEIAACSYPPYNTDYCSSQTDCRYAQYSQFTTIVQTKCLASCQDFTTTSWKSCNRNYCGPTTAGYYCSDYKTCKQYDTSTGLWSTDPAQTKSCVNQCYNRATDSWPTCNPSTCHSPGTLTEVCTGQNTCTIWNTTTERYGSVVSYDCSNYCVDYSSSAAYIQCTQTPTNCFDRCLHTYMYTDLSPHFNSVRYGSKNGLNDNNWIVGTGDIGHFIKVQRPDVCQLNDWYRALSQSGTWYQSDSKFIVDTTPPVDLSTSAPLRWHITLNARTILYKPRTPSTYQTFVIGGQIRACLNQDLEDTANLVYEYGENWTETQYVYNIYDARYYYEYIKIKYTQTGNYCHQTNWFKMKNDNSISILQYWQNDKGGLDNWGNRYFDESNQMYYQKQHFWSSEGPYFSYYRDKEQYYRQYIYVEASYFLDEINNNWYSRLVKGNNMRISIWKNAITVSDSLWDSNLNPGGQKSRYVRYLIADAQKDYKIDNIQFLSSDSFTVAVPSVTISKIQLCSVENKNEDMDSWKQQLFNDETFEVCDPHQVIKWSETETNDCLPGTNQCLTLNFRSLDGKYPASEHTFFFKILIELSNGKKFMPQVKWVTLACGKELFTTDVQEIFIHVHTQQRMTWNIEFGQIMWAYWYNFSDPLNLFYKERFPSNIDICKINKIDVFSDSSCTIQQSRTLSNIWFETFKEDHSLAFYNRFLFGARKGTTYIKFWSKNNQRYYDENGVYNYNEARTITTNFLCIPFKWFICGDEIINVSNDPSLQTVFNLHSWMGDVKLDYTFLSTYFTGTTEPTFCPIVRWALSKDTQQSPFSTTDGNMMVPISPLDQATGSDIFKINNISLPIQQQFVNIATLKQPVNFTFTLYVEAQTWGVSAFKQITVNIEKQYDNCLGGRIQPTFGTTHDKLKYRANDTDNLLAQQLRQVKLEAMGPTVQIIFEEFYLTNLTEGTDRYNTGCQQIEYKYELFYYDNQKYDGSMLEARRSLNQDFITLNNYSMPHSKLATSEAMLHYKTKKMQQHSQLFNETLKTLDASKLYNVVTFNMETTKNGTYLLQISAYQNVYTSHLKNLEKNVTFDFHFIVNDCNPVSYNKSVFVDGYSNSTVITYFLNNGSETHPIDFYNQLQTTPRCTNRYIPKFEINYSQIQKQDSKGNFKQIDSALINMFKRYIQTDYEVVTEGKLQVKFDSIDYIGLYFISGWVRPFNLDNPDFYGLYTAVEPIGFYLNARNIIFKNNTAPSLIESKEEGGFELKRTFEASNVTKIETYKLPPIRNTENDTLQFYFEKDSDYKYLKYDKKSHTFEFSDFTLKMSKDFSFKFTIQDENEIGSKKTTYDFTINCTYCVEETIQIFVPPIKEDEVFVSPQERFKKSNNSEQTALTLIVQPTMVLKSITNDGIIGISFSKPMQYPEAWVQQYAMQEYNTKRKLQDIDLGIRFTVITTNKAITERLKFYWEFKTLEPKLCEIQIIFDDPNVVSTSNQADFDFLEIEFTNRLMNQLVDSESELPIDLSNYQNQQVFTKKLPTQVATGEETEKFKGNIDNSKNSMQAVVYGNFLMSMLVSFSLNYLWSMINCLQLLVYLPLFNVIFPANIQMVVSILISVATFDVVPMIDEIQDFLFNFVYTSEINERESYGWEALGFNTKNFTRNSGSMFLVVLIFIVMRICEQVSLFLTNFSFFWIPIYKYFESGSIIEIGGRFLLEGFIDLFTCALLNTELIAKMDIIFTNFSDAFVFVLAIIFFLILLAMPIIVAKKVETKIELRESIEAEEEPILRFQAQKKEEQHDRHWGVFTEGLRHYCNWSMLQPVIYIIRRMLFVLMAFYWHDLLAFQLMGNAFLSQWYMIYNTNFRPYLDSQLNVTDFVNDMVVVVFNLLMFCLTDFVSDPITKMTVGSWMIYIIIFMLGQNVVIIFYKVFKIALKKYKQRQMKKEYLKIKMRIMEKYTIRQQEDIIQSIKTETPLEKVQQIRRRRLRTFKMKFIPMYQLSKISEESLEDSNYQDISSVSNPILSEEPSLEVETPKIKISYNVPDPFASHGKEEAARIFREDKENFERITRIQEESEKLMQDIFARERAEGY